MLLVDVVELVEESVIVLLEVELVEDAVLVDDVVVNVVLLVEDVAEVDEVVEELDVLLADNVELVEELVVVMLEVEVDVGVAEEAVVLSDVVVVEVKVLELVDDVRLDVILVDEVVVSVTLMVNVDVLAEVVVWVVELNVVMVMVVIVVVSVTVDGRLHVTSLQVPSSQITAPPDFECPGRHCTGQTVPSNTSEQVASDELTLFGTTGAAVHLLPHPATESSKLNELVLLILHGNSLPTPEQGSNSQPVPEVDKVYVPDTALSITAYA